MDCYPVGSLCFCSDWCLLFRGIRCLLFQNCSDLFPHVEGESAKRAHCWLVLQSPAALLNPATGTCKGVVLGLSVAEIKTFCIQKYS